MYKPEQHEAEQGAIHPGDVVMFENGYLSGTWRVAAVGAIIRGVHLESVDDIKQGLKNIRRVTAAHEELIVIDPAL